MTDTDERIFTISHPNGLHLRPAALFVKTAAHYISDITIQNLNRDDVLIVDAKSMFGIMQIGVLAGQRVRVRASGEDAAAALDALQQLVDTEFAEPT